MSVSAESGYLSTVFIIPWSLVKFQNELHQQHPASKKWEVLKTVTIIQRHYTRRNDNRHGLVLLFIWTILATNMNNARPTEAHLPSLLFLATLHKHEQVTP